MFDRFSKTALFFQAVVRFSREGMKPSPALGTLFAEIPQGYAGFNDLGGLADGTSFEERLHSVAETAIKKGISK